MEELKKKEKRLSKLIRISWLLGLLFMVIFSTLFIVLKKNIFAYFGAILLLLSSVIATVFEFQQITTDAKLMWYNYKDNNSLSSGVLLVVTIFVIPLVYLSVLLRFIPDEWKGVLQSLITCLLAAFPAILSLLGIHYSNMVQQISKKRETQNINKPYPVITMDNDILFNEDDECNLVMNMDIQNIANNILIPISVSYSDQICELNYSPINNEMHSLHPSKRINLGKEVTKTTFDLVFKYKDSLENTYKSDFVVDIKVHGKVVAHLSEGVQLYD